ncbi:hypothetical protein BpHYR1_046679 [Brachionus plicatilis]|uniref:Uncharacterized protein n=1 Tax=Brachionus plicatilis TaxID=10195 RepID=A0A3M7RVK7_BRAPC|nr:hypothetical protein BpHYR1_046679 [Brachionus plicatilis]
MKIFPIISIAAQNRFFPFTSVMILINLTCYHTAGRYRLPTKHMPLNGSPSTSDMVRIVNVLMKGTSHATRWKYAPYFEIASVLHFRPAAKNQVNEIITHQTDAAMPK